MKKNRSYLKKFCRKFKRVPHLTMMVIPHEQGKTVRNFYLPLWLVKFTVVLCVACFLTVGCFAGGYFYLLHINEENKELRRVNLAQTVEIKELKGLTEDMNNKLAALLEIDREVRAKVGLSRPVSQEVLKSLRDSCVLDSYTLLTIRLSDRQGTSFNYKESLILAQEQEDSLSVSEQKVDSLEDLKVELVQMDRLLTEQAKTMDKLKFDVEKQLAEKRAIPDAWPLRGQITSGFGWRQNPFDDISEEYHKGLDIAGSYGAPVCAAGNGVVILADYHECWGNVIMLSHGFGYVSQYAHNSSLLVKAGDKVVEGEIIARLGSTGRSTGAHLHFGVAKNGEWLDPLTVLK